jgi:RNA polymerase sigma-70 factor (ECF subfamily)
VNSFRVCGPESCSLDQGTGAGSTVNSSPGVHCKTSQIRDGALEDYPYLHAARGDLLRRLDRGSEAADAYRRALELTENRAERTFLEGRLREVARPGGTGRLS